MCHNMFNRDNNPKNSNVYKNTNVIIIVIVITTSLSLLNTTFEQRSDTNRDSQTDPIDELR